MCNYEIGPRLQARIKRGGTGGPDPPLRFVRGGVLCRGLMRQKKNMCVYCHMLKKIRVGRSEIIFFLILFFITELMLDGI